MILDNNMYLMIGFALCIILPLTASRIYVNRLFANTSDIDVLRTHYNKNRKILNIILYSFIGYAIIGALLTIFIPSIKIPFYNANVYIMSIGLTIAFFFAFNKRNISTKIIKK
ncbi:MAG TPA: hypothetical protein GX005_05285 [Bacteroidales bacterium]|nr:hypothetical protein [Bacteroidales bacterium]